MKFELMRLKGTIWQNKVTSIKGINDNDLNLLYINLISHNVTIIISLIKKNYMV